MYSVQHSNTRSKRADHAIGEFFVEAAGPWTSAQRSYWSSERIQELTMQEINSLPVEEGNQGENMQVEATKVH